MERRLVAVVWLVAFCMGAGLGCSNSHAEETSPRYGGSYRVPLLNNPPTLDPAYVQDMYGVAVVQQLFDGLVRFGPDLYVVPALAENWQVKDKGKTYRFFLRKDAQFHDGRPVTAKDAAFSITRLFRTDPKPTILPHLLKISGAAEYRDGTANQVSGLEVENDSTLSIHLIEPYAPFLVALGMYQAKVVPQEVVHRDAKAFGQRPVGNGAFRFVDWRPNKNIRLQGFDRYYGGKPFLDEINYIIYPGINIEAVFQDFTQGRLEEMEVYGEFLEALKKQKDLKWVHRPSLSLQFYGINCQHPRLRSRELRLALTKSIDRKELMTQVYGNLDEPANQILPPGLPGYNPLQEGVVVNVEASRKHLEEAAGESDSRAPLEIISNSQSQYAQAELKFVQEAWGALGIEAEPKFLPDWSEFEQFIQSESVQLYRYVWFADLPDPDDFLRSLFASDSQFNYMGYHDEQVDQLLQTAVAEIDPVRRASMYNDIQAKILETAPLIPVSHFSINMVYQPLVNDVEVSALGAHTTLYHRVWLQKNPPQ